jgi:hypothetical protein
MLALERLVRNLGGVAVVVHRLGGRHVGTGPFKTKRQRVQIERIKKELPRYSDPKDVK